MLPLEMPYATVIGGKTSMALVNNRFFVTHDADLICLEASSGTALWTRNGTSQFVGRPLLVGNKVIVVAGNQLVA